jgi:hypothetical protein
MGLAAIAHRRGFMAVDAQQIAEQFEIEFVVLDNEHPLAHVSPTPREARL